MPILDNALVIPWGLKRASLKCWLLATSMLLAYFSPATNTSTAQLAVWPIKDWQHTAVTSALQTPDGYLWFGTYHGLIRHDGARFTVFDGGNTEGLCNGIITSLFLHTDGVLWIGHETGEITRFKAGRFESVRPGKPWPGGPVEGFALDEQDHLWAWNDTGQFFRIADGHSLFLGLSGPVRKPLISRAVDGTLWFGLGERLSQLKAGALHDPKPGVLPLGANVECLRPTRDGGFWVLTREASIKFLKGGKVAEFPPVTTTENSITSTLELQNGTLLAGTSRDGLAVLAPGNPLLRFTRAQGLSHDWVRAMCEDHEGNVWIGTAAGLDVMRARRVQMISPTDDWQGCSLLSFCVRQDGSIWLGTEGAGLYRYQNRQWSRYGISEGIPNEYVWSVLETSKRELLIATWGSGVVSERNNGFEVAGELGSLTTPVPALYEGQHGELWVGTTSGLLRYEGGRITFSIGKDSLALPDIRAIAETEDGTLWFGMSGGGLGALRENQVKQYRKSEGLPSDFILSLCPDNNNLWIGTADRGLVVRHQGKFCTIGPEQGLPDPVISHIVDDKSGHLWLGARQGILRVSKSELLQVADGTLRAIHCTSYGRAEGLTAPTISGGFQPGATRTSDGRLWFPTSKGLAVLNSADFHINPHAPPVIIEELNVDGAPVPLTAAGSHPLRIAAGRQRFEVRYTGLSFASPDKVRFRYKLEGLEHDWIEAGPKRVAQYSYLQPGSYQFRVLACNNDNVWNEQGAALAFVVLPHFWQTWWFILGSSLLAATGLGGGVFWISRRRIRKRLEILERQRALERERARIARDIHDDLGASLTRITMLSQSVRADVQSLPATAGDVDQIFETARELTRALDEIVWAVNPRHDTLDSLVTYLGRFAQTFLSSAGIRCRLDVPVQLPSWSLTSEIRHNLFLAFKESLNNVAKHARATEVRINLELLPRGFLLQIADNGCGFSLPPLPPSIIHGAPRNGGGNGLSNMCRRLEELGGRCSWDTSPGEGTRVRFALPLARNGSASPP